MAEKVLKRKITLKRKEEQGFSFNELLKIKLFWQSQTDLDLCLFFVKKNGEIGGIFSNEYRNLISDLGNLNRFPFMEHMGDRKEPTPGGTENEQINIVRLDEIEIAYICIVNYDAAIEGRDVSFAQESGRIIIESDTEENNLEVAVDSNDTGHVYCVCSIRNLGERNILKNEYRVMSINTAFEEIPGFELIVNS